METGVVPASAIRLHRVRHLCGETARRGTAWKKWSVFCRAIATLLEKNADFNGVHLTGGGARCRRVDQRRRAAVGSAAAVFTVAAVNQIPIALALVVAQVWAAEGGWANSAPLLFGRPVLKNSHSESWQTWLISCGLGLTCICQVRSASYNRVHAPHHFCTKLQARHGA